MKIFRRLGVSPGPVAFDGPTIVRLPTPELMPHSENRSSTPRAFAWRTTETPTAWGPAGTRTRLTRGASRPITSNRAPSIVISTGSSVPTAGNPNPPAVRVTLNSYSASSGKTCSTAKPPRVPAENPSRVSACDSPRGAG